MKIPVTPAGIEPATFRFVAQRLNHCATAVPQRSLQLRGKNKDIGLNTTIFIRQQGLCVDRATCFDLNYVIFRLLNNIKNL